MKQQPAQYIIVSQVILLACLALCMMLVPRYFFSHNQGGISNYGTDGHTRWLFAIGFTVAGVGTIAAGRGLGQRATGRRGLRHGLYILGALYLVVMASTFPYKLSPAYRQFHEEAAITLFIGMLALAVWAHDFPLRNWRLRLAFTGFAFGFSLATLTTLGVFHLLFTGQLVCAVSFSYMLAQGMASTTRRQRP